MSICKYSLNGPISRNYSPYVSLNPFVFGRKTDKNGSPRLVQFVLDELVFNVHAYEFVTVQGSVCSCIYARLNDFYFWIHCWLNLCKLFYMSHLFNSPFQIWKYIFLHIFENKYEVCSKSHCHFFLFW